MVKVIDIFLEFLREISKMKNARGLNGTEADNEDFQVVPVESTSE